MRFALKFIGEPWSSGRRVLAQGHRRACCSIYGIVSDSHYLMQFSIASDLPKCFFGHFWQSYYLTSPQLPTSSKYRLLRRSYSACYSPSPKYPDCANPDQNSHSNVYYFLFLVKSPDCLRATCCWHRQGYWRKSNYFRTLRQ